MIKNVIFNMLLYGKRPLVEEPVVNHTVKLSQILKLMHSKYTGMES